MKPGRELDALIAEKVMGWDKQRIVEADSYIAEDGSIKHDLPQYSVDIKAAWEVVEKLKQVFKDELLLSVFWDHGYWFVNIDVFEKKIRNVKSTSAPHAICLAALQEKNIKIPE